MAWFRSKRKQRRRETETRKALAAMGLSVVPSAELLRATFDVGQTTAENRRHWAKADLLSPIAAATSDVRALIRSRARYEVANNSIAKGIVLTLANDLIGRGPRLQLLTDNDQINRVLEREFARWAARVNLAGKLRTLRIAKAQDGEGFGVMFTNRRLALPLKLDLCLIEADRVMTPSYGLLAGEEETRAVDGIVFDGYGNPEEYHILKQHPGARTTATGGMAVAGFQDYDRVPASSVVHWFRQDRPGQRRGLPDMLPALPLFAILRRYTLATLTAAETAADLSVIMKSAAPADGEAAQIEPGVTMELERNMAMFMPEGWEPSQMKAEHPSASFADFRGEIVNEIARCLNMPRNVALCNSAGYNYASGRLDHQTYFKSLDVEHGEVEQAVLDPLLDAWIGEAVHVPQLELLGEIGRTDWPHSWFWSGHEHVDPAKEARAADILMKAGLLSEADYYGRRGQDWEEQQEQREREAQGREKRGLPALVQEGAQG